MIRFKDNCKEIVKWSFVERKYYFSSVNVEQMKANIVYLYYTMSKNIARNFI